MIKIKHSSTQQRQPRMTPSFYVSTLRFMGIALFIGALGPSQLAYADEWSDEEGEIAPMIEAYQGLSERAEREFEDLDNYFKEDEDPSPSEAPTHRTSASPRQDSNPRSSHSSRGVKRAQEEQRHPAQIQKQSIPRREEPAPQASASPSTQERAPKTSPQGSSASEFEREVLRLINAERAQGGVCGGRAFPPSSPLNHQAQLHKAARAHGIAMSRRGFFDHVGPDGDTPRERINNTGYQGRMWGENIAAGQRSPRSVVRAWMESPGHCQNILNPTFKEIGISFIFEGSSRYKTYWVQAFGTPR